jgi:hypothetical protein
VAIPTLRSHCLLLNCLPRRSSRPPGPIIESPRELSLRDETEDNTGPPTFKALLLKSVCIVAHGENAESHRGWDHGSVT